MKIAFIIPSLVYAGPILVVKYIADHLSNEHQIDVYYFDDKVEIKINANLFRINFLSRINFSKYDIVHTNMLRPDFYIFIWSKLFKIRAVKISTVHQNILHDQKSQRSYFYALLITKLWHTFIGESDVIVTLNQEMFENYQKLFPKQRVVKIFNGIPVNVEDESIPIRDLELILKFKSKFKCIGSAARINKNKGFDQIVKVLELLNDFCFICIGDGPEVSKLKNLAKSNNTENRILFLGRRSNAKRYFKYFNVFAMTSEKEGFPISLLEAASFGIPAVCTKNNIFLDLFDQTEVSYFDFNNIESLKEAIIFAFENSTYLSEEIQKKFKRSYTSIIMAENYLTLYKSLLIKN